MNKGVTDSRNFGGSQDMPSEFSCCGMEEGSMLLYVQDGLSSIFGPGSLERGYIGSSIAGRRI